MDENVDEDAGRDPEHLQLNMSMSFSGKIFDYRVAKISAVY